MDLFERNPKAKKSYAHLFFLAPYLLIFAVFFLLPLLYGIYASFTKWDLFGTPQWIGLKNYKTLFTNTDSTFYRQFWNGMKNTTLFVVMMVPVQVLLPLMIALALHTKPKWARLFQGVLYVPTLFSISSVILTWFFVLHPSYGLVNKMLGLHINWFGELPYGWISIVAVTAWWIIGMNMVIYVAALGNIDASITESAQIDGAGWLKRTFYISLPLIKFQLLFTIMSATTSQFNLFGQPLMLTRGGPNEGTYTIIMYIRDLAFGSGKPIAGMASAMSVLLGLFIGVFAVAQMAFLLRQQHD